MELLFGRREVRANHRFQVGLADFSARLPARPEFEPAKLALGHTLLPYEVAFRSLADRQRALLAVIDGPTDWLHAGLGLVASIVRGPRALRFCPECSAFDVEKHGELFWRRRHQLPGVLVCPAHRRFLCESAALLSTVPQHTFLAADDGIASSVLRQRPMKVDVAHNHLIELASASADLLYSSPPPPPGGWGAHYREAVLSRGFKRGQLIDQTGLADAFIAQFGGLFNKVPALVPDTWLADVARHHRKSLHPCGTSPSAWPWKSSRESLRPGLLVMARGVAITHSPVTSENRSFTV